MKCKLIITAILLAGIPAFFWMYMFLQDAFLTPEEIRAVVIIGGTVNMFLLVISFLTVVFAVNMKDGASDKMIFKP